MSKDETDEAIAAYRNLLATEAELADRDIDEIEDHLRELSAELRATGMPAATAVTEAARRLGEPRAVAREHARVRTAFGTKLSVARTWSVAALLLPAFIYYLVLVVPYVGWWSRITAELGLGIALSIALVLRLSWARPVLLGGMAFFVIPNAVILVEAPDAHPLWLVWNIAVVAFLMPWRRHELTGAGMALALAVWSYGAATYSLGFQVNAEDGSFAPIAPAALVACGVAAVSAFGGILRARWSAISFVLTALLLAATAYELSGLEYAIEHPRLVEASMLGLVMSGSCASLVGAVLAWRSARSLLGSLRSLAS